MDRRGFTMTELLVAIVILIVLGFMLLGSVGEQPAIVTITRPSGYVEQIRCDDWFMGEDSDEHVCVLPDGRRVEVEDDEDQYSVRLLPPVERGVRMDRDD